MSDVVKSSVADGMAFLVVEQPPANALTAPVRDALIKAVKAAGDDGSVQEIVILGANGRFPAYLVESEETSPTLSDLCHCLEEAPKPVIAGLQGAVLGGACSLALAAHYRVADVKTRMGFPDTRYGILPPAGATQRAPRILGSAAALDLLLGQAPMDADDPRLAAMIDMCTDQPVVTAVVAFCKELRDSGAGVRPTCDRRDGLEDYAKFNAGIKAVRAKLAKVADQSPKAVLECVEVAALLPFEAGLAREDDAREEATGSVQYQALQHLRQAEYRAYNSALPTDGSVRDVDPLGVLGSGALAVWTVQKALSAGLDVNWGAPDPDVRKAGIVSLVKALGGDPDDPRFENLRTGPPEQVADECNVICIASPDMASFPLPDDISRFKVYPDRVDQVALRYAVRPMAPRLVEVVAGPEAVRGDVVTAISLVRKLGLLPVEVASSGFSICDRLAAACFRATDALVDVGQSPFHIDETMRRWGWSVPPFVLRDRRWLDASARMPRAKGAVNWATVPMFMDRKGANAGGGFYDHDVKAGTYAPSKDVLAAINQKRPAADPMPHDQIVELMIGALANEGARMLADQWARRAGDIDLAAVFGLDFPRMRGGPMLAADLAGLLKLSNRMKALPHPDEAFWAPHSMIAELIKNGSAFCAD